MILFLNICRYNNILNEILPRILIFSEEADIELVGAEVRAATLCSVLYSTVKCASSSFWLHFDNSSIDSALHGKPDAYNK